MGAPTSLGRAAAGCLRVGCVLMVLPALPAVAQTSAEPLAKLQAVPFTQVQIKDAFWSPRREVNRKVSLPHSLDMLEKAGNVRNFELAAKGAREGYSGPVFMDSDLYKTLEAVSYSLTTDPDPALQQRLDAIIAKIAAAQQPDGYLDTWFIVKEPDKRWTNLRDNHELYCAGHLFEAAVAHFQATGQRTLLDIAIKLADHIDSVFGDGPGKRLGYPGHPEIELALVKLWRVTGQQRYFELARFFIENRGRHFFATEHDTPLEKYDGTYWQDDVPICEQRTIKGHAVRAGYLLCGAVDVAAETGDVGLLKMVERVWQNTTTRRMYVTGGIGPSASNEGFTSDYDLPNLTAYQETCASVAMVLWNHRLNLLYGDARYADLVELALYNGILAGVSLDGQKFFYVNPLASQGGHHRSEWFGCACCPPNLARTLAALGGYAYATSPDGLWVNLYIQGSVDTSVAAQKVALDVTTDYPWDGKVKLVVKPETDTAFALRLRVPGWCMGATVQLNGKAAENTDTQRGYLVLDRTWKSGDVVELNLPMPPRRIGANPLVKEDAGLLAVARGPLIYCFEGCDLDVPLSTLALPADAVLTAAKMPDLLGGVTVLKGEGLVAAEPEWKGGLYRRAAAPQKIAVAAIPYYAWDNRAAGEMRVWLPTAPPPPRVLGLAQRADVSLSFKNGNCQPEGINDGVEPQSSSQQPAALCHWWPHKGSTEWVQYTWKQPVAVTGAHVYWFDDTGRGECRLPASWRLLYRDGYQWKPVEGAQDYPVARDKWCEVRFPPVQVTALRLEVQMQPNWAAGIHEWKVLAPDEDE